MPVATINWNGTPASLPDPNSCQITYAAGDLLYDPVNAETFPAGAVSTAIRDFLVGHGWAFMAASQPVGKYAFTASNLPDANGGNSTKYIILDFTTSGRLFMKVYETIAGNGTLSNLFFQTDVYCQVLATKDANAIASSNGKLWIGVSAHHLVIHSNSMNLYGNQGYWVGSGPIGVFELTRTSPLDLIGGYPKYGFLDDSFGINSNENQPLKVGRSPSGTGSQVLTAVATTFGIGGCVNDSFVAPQKHMPSFINPVTGKAQASNLSAQWGCNTAVNSGPIGTLMNIVSITKGYGAPIGDEITLPMKADPDFGNVKFFDPTGTPESYWLLGQMSQFLYRFAIPK